LHSHQPRLNNTRHAWLAWPCWEAAEGLICTCLPETPQGAGGGYLASHPHHGCIVWLRMKMLPALLAGIALLVGCGDGTDDHDVLNDLDDPKPLDKILGGALPEESVQKRGPRGEQLVYALNSQVPYTGWVKNMWNSGQVRQLKHYKDGKREGLYTSWDENGEKKQKGTFKDGKQDGLWTSWDENGQKEREGTRKDGKLEGLDTTWHDNGEKKWEGTYKDDQRDGLWTMWDENGQKLGEGTWKHGEGFQN
jgi:hypothetical protein